MLMTKRSFKVAVRFVKRDYLISCNCCGAKLLWQSVGYGMHIKTHCRLLKEITPVTDARGLYELIVEWCWEDGVPREREGRLLNSLKHPVCRFVHSECFWLRTQVFLHVTDTFTETHGSKGYNWEHTVNLNLIVYKIHETVLLTTWTMFMHPNKVTPVIKTRT